MKTTKGKPSGKFAESKKDPGRKGDYKRSGWPEDAPTQRVASGEAQQPGLPHRQNIPGAGRGRNRKAGSPV